MRSRAGRLATRLLLAAVIAYSALHLGYSIWRYNPFSSPASQGDVLRTYVEAREWRQTGSVDLGQVLYPAMYYALMAPLTRFDWTIVMSTWYGAQFIVYAMALWLMVRTVSDRPSLTDYLLAGVLMVNFQPFLETVAQFKVEGLEFFLMCLAIYLFKRRRDRLAGATILFAANLKYFPGILLVYFLLKREWRVIAGAIAAGGVILLGLLLVYDHGLLRRLLVDYPLAFLFGHTLEGTWLAASLEFQNVSGAINRAFVGPEGMLRHFRSLTYVELSHPELAARLAAVVKALCVAAYVVLVRRRWTPQVREQRWPAYLCEMTCSLVLLFVLAQSTRTGYAMLLLPGFILMALMLARAPGIFGWPERILLGLGYALSGMVIPGGAMDRLLPAHPLWGAQHFYAYLWFSLPFYGYLLLGLCAARCALRLERGARRLAAVPAAALEEVSA